MKHFFSLVLFLFNSINFLHPQGITDNFNASQDSGYYEIRINYNSKELKCLVFLPPDSAVSAGIILVHEEWGITDWVISISSQIADMGYMVVTPDLVSVLVSGKETVQDSGNEEDIRNELINATKEQINAALDASFEWLKINPVCNGRIAIIGFSCGGTRAFHYLSENKSLAAGIIFYGKSPESKEELSRIKSPVYGIYGEYDTQMNASLAATIHKMKKLGKEFHPIIIEGGGHGFMRSGERPGATEDNIKARTAGWNHLIELLGRL